MYCNVFDKIFSWKKNTALTAFLQEFSQKFYVHYFFRCISVYIISEFNTTTVIGAPKFFFLADPEFINKLSFILKTIYENHVKISGPTSS